MKSVVLMAIIFSFVLGIVVANGQSLRSSLAAPPGAAIRLHGGSTGVPTQSRFAPPVLRAPSPERAWRRAPHVHHQFSPPVIVPRLAPQPYYYRTQLLPRHPGIVIIDVPHARQSTVITQVAPGVVREVRRQGESPSNEAQARAPGHLAPFDPTPEEVVGRMLALASLKPGELLYDLGAGDGRVVIAAAKEFAVRAVGFEIDPGLVKLARENVRKQGVENLVEIRQQDILSADLSPASVVTLYLSYDGNLAVRPKLMTELKPGARVVSYTFDMGNWQAKITEGYRDREGNNHMIYLWQMGEPLAFR